MCHWGATRGKWGMTYERARVSAAAMLASVHMLVPPKAKQSYFSEPNLSWPSFSKVSLSFSLPVSAASWHFTTCVSWGGGEEIFWFCGWKCAPRCLFVISPPLWLRALPRLRAAHPSFLAIAPSSSCTCPQRPIWKQTPPIFNSSLFIFICHHVRAELHSVASPLPATFADFPHTQACKRTHKPNTQTHTNFQQVSST